MLKGKTVVLGVSSSIAAYKIANLASMLVKQHANVRVIMTQNATNFITPTTFETLTGQKCLVDTFDRNFEFQVEHVSLAKQADIFMIAPATANVIAKVSHGLADDMLTTTFLACKAPKYLAPAMNTQMYENPITQDNLNICRKYGMHIIEPASGYLACGDIGAGKMPEPETLLEYILQELVCEKDLAGKKVLVTAGPTREAIDPVRYITNHSTGKMGYAIARAAARRGAEVTLVSGPVDLKAPMEFPEGKYSIRDTMEELAKSPEAFEITAHAVKLATNFIVRPGVGMWDMMKKMTPESMAGLASGTMPEGFLESLNAKLIKIDRV